MIRQIDNNRYLVRYSKRHPITRRPVSLKQYARSKAEASRVHSQLIIRVEDKLRAQILPTWEKTVEMWGQDALNRGLTAKTVETYNYSLRAFTFGSWKGRLIDTITTDEIRFLILDIGGRSNQRKNACLKYTRAVFNFALEKGYINRNPTPKLTFSIGEKIKMALSRTQAEKLLDQAKAMESEWYPHWVAAMYTGMRSGELHALTWDKIDFDRKTILVNCSWSKKNGLKSTKSGDDRLVPLADDLATVLRELKLNSEGCPYVLPRLAKWDKGEQARELRYFMAGIGMESVRFHDLRATFATLLLQNGVEPIKLMKAGGWKTLKTMMIYIRKAGVDIDGMMDGFSLYNPNASLGKVLQIKSSNEVMQDAFQ